MNTTLWTLWCACGFVGWMGAEVLNCEEDSDLLSPRVNERDPVANLSIFLTDLFLGPMLLAMLLAIVVRRYWVKK